MTVMNFPSDPALNDEYSFQGRTWKWNGFSWELVGLYQIDGPRGYSGYSGIVGRSGFSGYADAFYDIGTFIFGRPDSGEAVLRHLMPRSTNFFTNSQYSIARCDSVATVSSAVFDVYKNSTAIGTMTFSTNSTTATFSVPQTNFLSGDTISIVAPLSINATLANISITLVGIKVV